jgi:holo-[acyl-carrier protein] synthase
MIFGIGVDLVDISRFEKALEQTPKLKERLFTESERGLSNQSLAARFAAKEALLKALGKAKGLSFQDVSVVKNEEGKPFFELAGETEKTIRAEGISKLHLSLSHDGNMAVAYVVAEVTK